MNDFTPVAIAPTDTKHILSVLTAQYSDPITSVLRELVTNALDAQHVAGTKTPVHVTLPSSDDPTLTVEDHGTGMDRESFERVQCAYGASTKRDDDDLIGKYGIGSKSVMMVADTYSITNTHEGHRWRADFELTESGPQYRITDLGPTEEHNGFCVKAQINQSEDGDPMQTCALWNSRAINFFWWIDPSLYRLTYENNDITLSENYFTQRSNTNYLATDTVKTFTEDNKPTKLTSNVVIMDHYAYQLYDVFTREKFPRNTALQMPTKSLHLTPNRERLVNDAHNRRVLEAAYSAWSQDIDARRKTDIDSTTCLAQAVYFYAQNREIMETLDWNLMHGEIETYYLIIEKYADDIRLIKTLLGKNSLGSLHGCGSTTSERATLEEITKLFRYQTWIVTVDQKDDQRPNKAALGDLRYWLKHQSETMGTHGQAIIWNRTTTQDQTMKLSDRDLIWDTTIWQHQVEAMNLFMDEAFLNSYPYTMSLDDVREEVKSMRKARPSVRTFRTQRCDSIATRNMTGDQIADHLQRTGGRLIVDTSDNLRLLQRHVPASAQSPKKHHQGPSGEMRQVLAMHRRRLLRDTAERDLMVYKGTAPGNTLLKESNLDESAVCSVHQMLEEIEKKTLNAAHDETRTIVTEAIDAMCSKHSIDKQTVADYVSLMGNTIEPNNYIVGGIGNIYLFAQRLLEKGVIPKLKKARSISPTELKSRLGDITRVPGDGARGIIPNETMITTSLYLMSYDNDLFTGDTPLGEILAVTTELWRNVSHPSEALLRATLAEDMR